MSNWAIVIGINSYAALPAEQQLHGAVADAIEFADWVRHPQGGGVADERFFFWTYPAPTAGPYAANHGSAPWRLPGTPDAARSPHVADVVGLVEELQNRAFAEAGSHRIFVFFAGHGVQVGAPDPQTCFVLGEYQGICNLGLLPCDELRKSLQTNGFEEAFLFLDCCRSQLDYRNAVPTVFAMGAGPQVRHAVARAASRGTRAFELPGQPPKRGAFTLALTEGLRTRRKGKVLTLNELETYVYERVGALMGGKQSPQFEIDPRNPPFEFVVGPAIKVVREIRVANIPAGAQVQLFNNRNTAVGKPVEAMGGLLTFQAPIDRSYTIAVDGKPAKSFRHGPGDTDVAL